MTAKSLLCVLSVQACNGPASTDDEVSTTLSDERTGAMTSAVVGSQQEQRMTLLQAAVKSEDCGCGHDACFGCLT